MHEAMDLSKDRDKGWLYQPAVEHDAVLGKFRVKFIWMLTLDARMLGNLPCLEYGSNTIKHWNIGITRRLRTVPNLHGSVTDPRNMMLPDPENDPIFAWLSPVVNSVSAPTPRYLHLRPACCHFPCRSHRPLESGPCQPRSAVDAVTRAEPTWKNNTMKHSFLVLGVNLINQCNMPVILYIIYMVVSWNRGTPKSSILMRFSLINHPYWGSPINGTPHMYISICL